MAKDDESIDKVQLTSNLGKEIMFDEKSGRFFETRLDSAECIPDEEYCQLDPDTGDLIRLTVAEKERIFLDALQVSWLFIYNHFCANLKRCAKTHFLVRIFLLVLLREWKTTSSRRRV
jgi:hypothetical protein